MSIIKGLTSPLTHYRLLRSRVFPVSPLHWHWRPDQT